MCASVLACVFVCSSTCRSWCGSGSRFFPRFRGIRCPRTNRKAGGENQTKPNQTHPKQTDIHTHTDTDTQTCERTNKRTTDSVRGQVAVGVAALVMVVVVGVVVVAKTIIAFANIPRNSPKELSRDCGDRWFCHFATRQWRNEVRCAVPVTICVCMSCFFHRNSSFTAYSRSRPTNIQSNGSVVNPIRSKVILPGRSDPIQSDPALSCYMLRHAHSL